MADHESSSNFEGLNFIACLVTANKAYQTPKKIMPFRFPQTQRVYQITWQLIFHWHPDFH
jgi:hypothetical protein